MNFVDAAVALLRESQGPMHVEELCRLALERGLLDSPGQSPLRSLKGRLTTELKRGPESRVIRVEDDLWALADAGRNGEEAHAATVEPETVVDADVDVDDEDEVDAAEEDDDDEDDEDDDDLDDDDEDDEDDDLDDDEDDEDEDEDEAQAYDEADADPAAGQGTYQAPEPAPEHLDAADADDDEDFEEADADDGDHDLDDEDTTDLGDDPIRRAEAAQRALEEQESLTSEEKELIQAYGGEPDTAQVGSLVEYRDQQTADEDRPMVPELLPERRGGRQREDWKARRERMREKRRERREGRERNKAAREQSKAETAAPAEGEAAPRSERAAERATERAAESAEAETPRPAAPPQGEGDLARRACEVLASIKGAQPVPVRQLAQMMKKRRLIEAEPDAVWRALKAALLADNQRRAAAGLPPRVAYRGRDLFSYRPSANAELESCETALETAAHRLRGATERVLAARLVDLPLPVLEQVIQLFLVQTGWREVEWIKRVDRSGYALAREPGDGAQVMIAARAGNQQVDRRGVGELRAGVAAKNLSRGFLLAPRELGGEARSELERPGKPVSALCGLPLASALVGAGIGVAQRMMTVSYLDVELFDRLAEGPESR